LIGGIPPPGAPGAGYGGAKSVQVWSRAAGGPRWPFNLQPLILH